MENILLNWAAFGFMGQIFVKVRANQKIRLIDVDLIKYDPNLNLFFSAKICGDIKYEIVFVPLEIIGSFTLMYSLLVFQSHAPAQKNESFQWNFVENLSKMWLC